MRTGKELILATREFAKDDPVTSWIAVITSALLLASVTAIALWVDNWLLRLPASIIAGLMWVRCFVIYHDHQHHAILDKSKLAERLMRAYGILAMTPSSIWKHSHNHHHNHNSKLRTTHIGSYPVMTAERYLRASKQEQRSYLAMRHPLMIAMGYLTIFVCGMCIIPLTQDPKKHRDAAYALSLHIALYALVASTLGLQAVLFGLFIPCLLAGAAGSYLFYAQHNFPSVSYQENNGWTYEGAALESSSYCVMGPLMNFFTGNIGYHHVHHLNAKIPFYRLPEAYAAMPELQQARTTTLHPAEIRRCLQLKVWDSAAQRMTPLPQKA
ncbi:fatty acid desaturase family protein [Coraliomargarita akajimensis]|uniref:Fatty acid desaturase n=1 Tax=Coraliomargarita akajimensis (strain DSM 45221 / IAM 15411 / JCM 23193 / KCTC 12865 / 04OKA010-24) TaxID=583355 RepID=D5EIX4_CORAD|nr:fatty acid desaturase [Coraliomargarita akajimensis]ADE54373.1 fatty acid desaturase [Coraliomargarita akajimensis DSM 45221]